MLAGSRLTYVGDEAQFALERAAIEDITVGARLPGWLRCRSVVINWRVDTRKPARQLILRAGAPTLLRISRRSAALAERLQAWRGRPGPAEPVADPAPALGPPSWGEVTSESPIRSGSLATVLTAAAAVAVIAVGLTVLLGLPLSGAGAAYGWYPPVAAFAVSWLLWLGVAITPKRSTR